MCLVSGFFIGEMRNDLYITVERGEFEKGGKSVARNVEVTMHVVDSSGQILKVSLLYVFPWCSPFWYTFLDVNHLLWHCLKSTELLWRSHVYPLLSLDTRSIFTLHESFMKCMFISVINYMIQVNNCNCQQNN